MKKKNKEYIPKKIKQSGGQQLHEKSTIQQRLKKARYFRGKESEEEGESVGCRGSLRKKEHC